MVHFLDVSALGNSAFLQAFAAAIIKQCGDVMAPNAALVLLRWISLILHHVSTGESTRKASEKLAQCLVKALEKTVVVKAKWPSAQRAFNATLTKRPDLFEDFLTKATTGSSPALCRALYSYSKAKGKDHHHRVLTTLLRTFAGTVLAAKEKVAPPVFESYAPLLNDAPEEAVSTVLIPMIVRMIKRSPEVALASAVPMLQALRMTRNGSCPVVVVHEMAPGLLQQTRHGKPAVRSMVAECAGILARKTDAAEAISSAVHAALGLLDGSSPEGRLKAVGDKVSVSNYIAQWAQTQVPMTTEAQAICSTLCTLYSHEVTDEGKGGLISALGAWVSKCTSKVPSDVLNTLMSGMTENKDILRRAHLKAAVRLCPEAASQLDSFASPIAKIVREGLSKATARGDANLALLIAAKLLRAGASCPSIEDVWKEAVENEASPLVMPTVVGKLPVEDAITSAQLFGTLLSSNPTHHLPDASKKVVAHSLTLLLLHYASSVRMAAREAAQAACCDDGGGHRVLLDALHDWISAPSEAAFVLQEPTAALAEVPVPPCILHERFFNALLAITPHNTRAAISGHCLALSMVLAHHPVVTASRKKPSSAWKAVFKTLNLTDASIIDRAEEIASNLIEAASTSPDACQRAAACEALSSAAASAASALMPHVVTLLTPILNRSDHDVIAPRELRIFYTPEGRLSNENDDGSIIPAEMLEELLAAKPKPASASSRLKPLAVKQALAPKENGAAPSAGKRPSQGGAVGAGKQLARPGGLEKKRDAAAEARAKQLIVEKEIRKRVLAIKERLSWGLAALGAFAAGNHSFTIANMGAFTPFVTPLLVSPVLSEDAAFECLKQLAMCLPGPLGHHSFDIACTLRLVAVVEVEDRPDYQALAAQKCMKSALAALQVATGGWLGTEDEPAIPGHTALPSQVYIFCFPILKAVLSCIEPTPLHDAALSVLSLHVGPAVDRAALPGSFSLLYHVLEVLPVFLGRIQPLLSALCSGMAVDDVAGLHAALAGMTSGAAHVRAAALEAMLYAPVVGDKALPSPEIDGAYAVAVLWMITCVREELNAEVAAQLWEESGAHLPFEYVQPLLQHTSSPFKDIREAAATALAKGAAIYPESASQAIDLLIGEFFSRASLDARIGTANALCALAPHVPLELLPRVLEFLVGHGLADREEVVRVEMVLAGVSVVDAHADNHAAAAAMLPLFEGALEKGPQGSVLSEAEYDNVRCGAVVYLGTLAAHLDPSNPKVKSVVETLTEVLATPSETVQRAVSDRLPPLLQALSKDTEFVKTTVASLLEKCLRGVHYGDRRGAAYGLAGVVKGLGISSLRGYGIMDTLKISVEDKSNPEAREGALCAFECLSDKLGRLFEPYVISILPMLLTAFGDAVPQVRAAAESASKVIMGQLTGQGVKLVLPSLLQGVEDRVWRTKHGSIQLLGAMAFCAPKQLSACLPAIVPKLAVVLADPHPKVSAAAQESLKQVGSVIKNPEISRLSPYLLAAIADPSKGTKVCLDKLLSTVFVNTIDAASLALIAPVVHRGLRDRSGDTKKHAARIVGNLSALINDPKDLAPYVDLLMPELQSALIDPLPEVRATAARALGSLVQGMGDAKFAEVLPWLLETMRSEGSAVERSGAAQGLAEVLSVKGIETVRTLLPDILAGCRARNAAMREGHLTLFKYLPHCMTEEYRTVLSDVLPCILDGLADEAEGVRDAALSAGRAAVELYAGSALPLLLPTVERGMQSPNWRIRQSSVELLGDLLFKVSGATGRIQQDLTNDEDEGISVEAHGAAIVQALGVKRRNQVLARVYLARSDVGYTVRTAALHVWKTIVTNTPKTLGELLPSLMLFVIDDLAAEDEDRRVTAGKCLGELVRKMGERILAQIIPILLGNAAAESPSTRQGVCLGLQEVVENSTRTQLAEHLAEILPVIQNALCDADERVRQSAGGVFAVLFKGSGGGAIDTVIPALLSSLEESHEKSDAALEGLRVVLSVRPQLLGSIVPRLLKPPITAGNLRALGVLAEVAGTAIHSHLNTVMPPLLQLASDHPDTSPRASAAHAAASQVALAVGDDGVHLLVNELVKSLDDPARRRGGACTISAFCRGSKLDFQEHIPVFLSGLVPLLSEDDEGVLTDTWTAVAAVTGTIPKEMTPSYVRCLRDALNVGRERMRRKTKSKNVELPGLSAVPKALAPLLPIYLQGVLQGSSPELRELAADGLSDLIELTSVNGLKPFIVQIMGPLIRIIGDKFQWQIKYAILKTMGLLIAKGGTGLKPFVPQLQTTFVKCLSDGAPQVRQQAAINLGNLTTLSVRLDPLVVELTNTAKSAEGGVQAAYLHAIKVSLLVSGERMAPETLDKVWGTLKYVLSTTGATDDEVSLAAAAATGALTLHIGEAEYLSLLNQGPLGPSAASTKLPERLAAAVTVAAMTEYAMDKVQSSGQLQNIIAVIIQKFSKDESVDIKQAAGKAAGRIVIAQPSTLSPLTPVFLRLLGPDQMSDTRRHALAVLRNITTTCGPKVLLASQLSQLVPSIVSVVQDSAGPAKLSAERTLARVLGLDEGLDAALTLVASGQLGASTKTVLTEAYLKRLAKALSADEGESEGYDV